MVRLFIWLLKRLKGGEEMMGMFFAQRVILGKTAFADVPNSLKEAVKEVLVESGLSDLVDSEV